MANSITYKDFEQTDIVAGKTKIKYFPAWSDVTTDADTVQQATLNSYYIKPSQTTGSVEGLYYWNIYQESPSVNLDSMPQFSIAYGHTGSISAGVPVGVYSAYIAGNPLGLGTEYNNIYPAWAIYRQLVNVTTNGNAYNNLTFLSGSTTYTMGNVYAIALNRTRIKDYIDPNTWQLNLSCSNLINLTAETATAANQTDFNVITSTASGYIGPLSPQIQGRVCGKFYADKGLIILDADFLYRVGAVSQSALSSGGPLGSNYYTASKVIGNFLGGIVCKNPGTLVANYGITLVDAGAAGAYTSSFTARSVERVQSTHYFVRAKNTEFNFSTNPTWVSGSDNEVLSVFYDEPKTFISTIALYDSTSPQAVAFAKTSKPIPKSADTEALVKIRLDFVWYLALSLPFIQESLKMIFA